MWVMQILSVLSIIGFVIMFIGYWTYADYYTNMDGSFRFIYWLTHAFMYGICAEIMFISGTDLSPKTTPMDSAAFVLGLGNSIFLSVAFLMYIFSLFHKSRNYFGQKRNKL